MMRIGFRYGMGIVMGAAAGLAVVGVTVAGGFAGYVTARKLIRKYKAAAKELSEIRIDSIDSEMEDIQS